MYRKTMKALLIIIITALVLMNAGWALASDYPQGRSALRKPNLSFERFFAIPQIDKAQISEARKKLSTDLLSLVDEKFMPSGQTEQGLRRQMLGSGQFRQTPQIMDSGGAGAGQIYVYIYLKPSARTSVVDPYVSIMSRDEENHYVAGWVNVSDLDSLAALEDVRSIHTDFPLWCGPGRSTARGTAFCTQMTSGRYLTFTGMG